MAYKLFVAEKHMNEAGGRESPFLLKPVRKV